MKNALFAALAVALMFTSTSCGRAGDPGSAVSPAPGIPATPGTPVSGLATMVKGKVEILLPGETAWKDLAVRNPVPPGSKIRAGADGEADVLLAEKGVIRLKPGTEITITENQIVANAPRIHVKLDAGRLLHRFDKLAPNAEYKLTTPSSVAGIRGTQFDIAAGLKSTLVRVLTGRVAVSNEVGQVEVGEKQGSLIASGAAPGAPQQLSPKDCEEILECGLLNFVATIQKTHRIATLAEMRNVSTPLEVWAASHDGLYPNSLDEGGAGGMTDDWNQPYRYEQLSGGRGYVILSNGPDKQPDTEDDLEYRRE